MPDSLKMYLYIKQSLHLLFEHPSLQIKNTQLFRISDKSNVTVSSERNLEVESNLGALSCIRKDDYSLVLLCYQSSINSFTTNYKCFTGGVTAINAK